LSNPLFESNGFSLVSPRNSICRFTKGPADFYSQKIFETILGDLKPTNRITPGWSRASAIPNEFCGVAHRLFETPVSTQVPSSFLCYTFTPLPREKRVA
jgi:hypothetical protein